jgi:hypothetical protein
VKKKLKGSKKKKKKLHLACVTHLAQCGGLVCWADFNSLGPKASARAAWYQPDNVSFGLRKETGQCPAAGEMAAAVPSSKPEVRGNDPWHRKS